MIRVDIPFFILAMSRYDNIIMVVGKKGMTVRSLQLIKPLKPFCPRSTAPWYQFPSQHPPYSPIPIKKIRPLKH
jgi:hypothetical protein